jgi:hypothetical protein
MTYNKKFLGRFSKGEMGAKRRFEVILMVMAVILILVIVPVVSALIYRWNNIRPQGTWDRLTQGDYYSVITSTEFYNEFTIEDQNGIVWGNDTDRDLLVVSSDDAAVISFALDFRVLDLYDNNTLQWRFSFNITFPVRLFIMAEELTIDDQVDWTSEGSTMFGGETGYLLEENGTVSVSWTALQLSTWNAETSNGIIVVSIVPDDYHDVWVSGDEVGFRFAHEKPPSGTVKEKTVWQWGAGLMGLVLLLVAFGSTPWWNPLKPKDPGWVDRQLKRIGRKRSKKDVR